METAALPARQQVEPADCWDLTPLFASQEDWDTLYKDLESRLAEYGSFRGSFHKSFGAFKACIVFHHDLARDLEKVYTFAHLRNDEDKTDPGGDELFQKAMNLVTRFSDASSFLVPEIQQIEDDTLSLYLADPAIAEYRFFLEKIVRNKPHTRSSEVEQILAMAGETIQAPRQIFGQLDNADLYFGTLANGDGKEKELTHGNFVSFLSEPDRTIRKQAFQQYYGVYTAHKHSIAAALSSSVKKDLFLARVRKFDNARQAALFKDDVSDSVYDNLVATVNQNLAPLYDYLDFRKSALKLDALHMYDTYVPLVPDVDFYMTYDEAAETCVRALAPLGQAYCDILEKGLTSGRWVDRYENKGKRNGAYSSGCYDSPPYILMNYDPGTINSLFTLIHEAGHSMHSHFSCRNQPYSTHDYTIFVAEVASTLNEILLSRFLLEKYKDDPKMKAYIINRNIDNIRATLFRQTMFAEFETNVHGLASQNHPLTLEVLTAEYRKLLDVYFGGHMEIDEALCLECLRIPHFYAAFYVYQYATGISAALAIADRIFSSGLAATGDYLAFLKLGGSRFPIDELKVAGVDMASPDPIQQAVAYFKNQVEELKSIWQSHLNP